LVPGRVFLLQNIVHLHQGNPAERAGRFVLLQNSLPESSVRPSRLPEKVLLLQINLCQLLSRAFLMQINRDLPRKNSAESSVKGFLMQNRASGLPASLLARWEKPAGGLAKAAGAPAGASGILDRVPALPDKGHEVPDG
jgi:hypothetical protein